MKRLSLAVIAGATLFGTVAASAQSEFSDSEHHFRNDANRFNHSRSNYNKWNNSQAYYYGSGPGVTVDVGPRYHRWGGGPSYYDRPGVGIGIGVSPYRSW